jgi:cyclin B
LSSRNSLKTQKCKNKSEFDEIKKLSINKKNSQSHERLNEALKEQMKTKENNKDLNEMNIENDNINNNVNENINSINNEINLEFIKIKNNMKEIVHSPLTLMTYEEFNINLVPYEYINDIWDNFIEKEKYNNYSFDSIISIQTDIKDSMRCILIDWIISLQNKFFRKSNTLFLTINLIDRYLSKRSIHRTKFQLLGVASLFIAFKYEEIHMKNINDFVDLTARAFDKTEILNMEKIIIDLVDFDLDLPLSNDFFDLLSTVYKFDKKEYFFGCFLLEAFLLDINYCKYKQSQIALATCFIVLGLRQMKRINPIEGNNFIEYYCKEYKINFEIWKDYNIIVNCAKKIYYYFENSDKINYREVYKVFNHLFI